MSAALAALACSQLSRFGAVVQALSGSSGTVVLHQRVREIVDVGINCLGPRTTITPRARQRAVDKQ